MPQDDEQFRRRRTQERSRVIYVNGYKKKCEVSTVAVSFAQKFNSFCNFTYFSPSLFSPPPFSLTLSFFTITTNIFSRARTRATGVVSKSSGEVEEAQEDDERVPVFRLAVTVARPAALRRDELRAVRRRDVPYPRGQMGNGDRSDINSFYNINRPRERERGAGRDKERDRFAPNRKRAFGPHYYYVRKFERASPCVFKYEI